VSKLLHLEVTRLLPYMACMVVMFLKLTRVPHHTTQLVWQPVRISQLEKITQASHMQQITQSQHKSILLEETQRDKYSLQGKHCPILPKILIKYTWHQRQVNKASIALCSNQTLDMLIKTWQWEAAAVPCSSS
jgi:hypothetical protein